MTTMRQSWEMMVILEKMVKMMMMTKKILGMKMKMNLD